MDSLFVSAKYMLGDKYIFVDEVIRFISEHEKKKKLWSRNFAIHSKH